MDIFVMAGEISYDRGLWNEASWRYNLLSEQWKIIEKYILYSIKMFSCI